MPDIFLTRRQIMMTALEATYATDAAPQATSYQAIRMIEPFKLDLSTEMLEQEAGLLTRGRSRPISTVRPIGVTFRTYVQGLDAKSYTATDKPPIGDLLRCCGLQETFASSNAAGQPEYRYDQATDVGSDFGLTIVAHQDGFEHRFVGARGNVNFIWQAAAPVIADFNFRGQLTTEASTTRTAPTGMPTVIPPRWIGSGTIFIGSLAANVENLNFNTNNTLFEQKASRASSASGIIAVWITQRSPGGSFDPEANSASDFFGAWRSTSGGVLRLQAGLTQSNRFTLVASQVIYKQVSWGDKEGMGIFSTDFEAYERNSDDSFRITFD